MSLPRDLDEYTKGELLAELDRRDKARRADVCDYCGRAFHESTCRLPDRHKRVGPMPIPGDAILRIKAVREAARCGLYEAKQACERAEWNVEHAIELLNPSEPA